MTAAAIVGLTVLPLSTGPVGATVTSSAPSGVSTDSDPDAEKAAVDQAITDLHADMEGTSQALTQAYLDLEQTRGRLTVARGELAAAQQAERVAISAHQEAIAARDVARANEERAVERLAATTERIESAREGVARFAAQVYTGQGSGELSVAMDAQTPQEFADRLAMVDILMQVQQASIGDLAGARAEQVAQEDLLQALRAEAEAAEQRAQQARAAATEARQRAAEAKAALDALAAQQDAQAADLERQRAAEKARYAKLQAESDRLAAVLAERARQARIAAAAKAAREKAAREKAAREAAAKDKAARDKARASRSPGSSSSSSSSSGLLRWPAGGRVSSEFGMRFHPVLGYSRLHAGLDIAADIGTPVYAAAGGTVFSAGWGGGHGNRILIDHGMQRGVNLVTSYSHLSRFAVTGGRVSAGQLIGYVGNTGTSTGPHLHFETHADGVPVNPRNWLS